MRSVRAICREGTAPWVLGAVLALALWLAAGCTPGGYSGEENDQNIQAGKLQRRSGFYLEAEEAFHRALQNHPNSAAAHYELGQLYYEYMTNYTAALYHFERYRALRTKPANDDVLKLMIVECKRELAKDVPLGTIGLQQQQEIRRLKDTNALLQIQVEQLRLQLAQRPPPAAANRNPTTMLPSEPSERATSAPAPARLTAPETTVSTNLPPRTPGARTHLVKPGETLAAIARRYKVELSAVIAANPGLDPRRLQPGQTVKVPGP